MASRPALGRKRGVAGLSRSRGGGDDIRPLPTGKRPVEAHGEELMAHHACDVSRQTEVLSTQ